MSGEQLPAVNTRFKLIEIILLICTMATSQHNAVPEVKPAVKSCRDLATLPWQQCCGGKGRVPLPLVLIGTNVKCLNAIGLTCHLIGEHISYFPCL